MLSRLAPSPCLPPSRSRRCDIFCHVIDNFGDVGVCWRLARQLASEHDLAVRLWVDRLETLAGSAPAIDPRPADSAGRRCRNAAAGRPSFRSSSPADLVIEAFACHLPEAFVAAMAARIAAGVDQPRLPERRRLGRGLPCPALAASRACRSSNTSSFLVHRNTGGLLREKDLEQRRHRLPGTAAQHRILARARRDRRRPMP